MSKRQYLIHPEIEDREVAERLVITEMVQLLKRAKIESKYIYAWCKCGFFPTDWVKSFRKLMGWPSLPNRLTDEEQKQWQDAVREYEEKGGFIPGY